MLNYKRNNLLIILFCITSLSLIGQGDLSINLIEEFNISSADSVPHYIKANNWGLVENDFLQSQTVVDLDYTYEINNKLSLETGLVSGFHLGENEQKVILGEIYGEINYNLFYASFGKKRETLGGSSNELTSGSMMISSNASPIPKVSIGIAEFMTIPYTFDVISIKGGLSHGWFEGNREIDNVFLHEKSFFIKAYTPFGLEPYFGLMHAAQWGGEDSSGSLMDLTFENYLKVFIADGGGSDSSINEQNNSLGNHLGTFEYGLYGKYEPISFHIYYQHFFEDGSGRRFKNIYDGLWGIELKPEVGNIWDSLLFEFLTTKHQSGNKHGEHNGKVYIGLDGYYTNYRYKNGWTHLNNIIGNSFFSSTGEDDSYKVANNRMNVLHLGISGEITQKIKLVSQVAYAEYFPAYSSVSLYEEKEFMWHMYNVIILNDTIEDFVFKVGVAYDFGSLKDVYGFSFTIEKSL